MQKRMLTFSWMQRVPCVARLCLVFGLAIAINASAAQPVLTGSVPRGIQRGTSAKVQFTGTRLQDARQLLMDIEGINVKSVTPVNNAKVDVELEIPAQTSPGLYPVRMVTKSGISNMMMFSVGAMPNVLEKEPNSEFTTPQPIENNVTIEGAVAREDQDFFVVELKEGQQLTAEIEGVRITKVRRNPFFDPYVAILNEQRFELATSDDAPLLQQDCLCSITAPADGKYIVLVRDSSFGGNNERYRLHVGSYPRPIATIPAGGNPGQLLDMTFVSPSGDAWIEKVQMPSLATQAFPLVVSNDQGIAPSPNYVRVGPHKNCLEKEPNNSFKESTPGELPAAFCGLIGEPQDNDFFSFAAKKNQTVRIRVFGRKVLRSQLDSVIDIYDAKGKRVGGNDDSGGPDSLVDYKIPADGTYHIRIYDHLKSGGPGFAYRIEANLVEPEMVLSLPDRRRYEATHIAIPKGNSAAVMLNVSRQRFGGAIDLTALNLPKGVTLTPIQMPANRTTVPVLLSATEDAPMDGRLVDFVGKVVDNDKIKSRFDQQHQLLIGQNNSVVFEYRSTRSAIAVTDASPCKISIVQPKVPVVRNGSASLVVKVDRGSYEADIPIRLLYNPPGIGASGSVKIPKGKNEASIPITANGSAAIGKWPVIVYAQISNNGTYEIASQPIDIEIADRFFNFTFPKTSSELGEETEVMVEVEVLREFAGTCEVELVGLPAGVTCSQPKIAIKNDSERISFPINVGPKARVGQHKTLVARATVTDPNGLIKQSQGTGTLQVDKPIPAPVKKPSAKPTTAKPNDKAKPAKPAPVKKKPLSRLEQLRQMHKELRESGQ